MPTNLSDLIPNASLEAIDLITRLCSWDPERRPTAEQALHHPFFHVGSWVPCPIRDYFQPKQNLCNSGLFSNSGSWVPCPIRDYFQPKQNLCTAFSGAKPNLELNLWDFGTESDDCFLSLTLAVKPSVSNPEIGQSVPQKSSEEMLFFSGYQDHSRESVFWPFLTPDRSPNDVPVKSSLSSSLMVNSQMSLQTVGMPQSGRVHNWWSET